MVVAPEFETSSAPDSAVFPPSSLSLGEHIHHRTRHDSSTRSDTS